MVGTGIYLLPSILAILTRHRNNGAVIMLNLLGGWTIIGWIIALIWSVDRDPSAI